MRNLGDRVTEDTALVSKTDTSAQPEFRRVLIPVKDASQVEHVVELARRAGASEARVLHLNLRESIGGRRYPLETDSSAADIVETAVLELRVAGIAATGQVRHALVDRIAQAIVADATEWGADLIVLGAPRRSRLATRLFGSVALRVERNAPCPVLVATDLGTGAHTRDHSDELSATPAR
jgi:nucleotide-binding universal stress UspA family protein